MTDPEPILALARVHRSFGHGPTAVRAVKDATLAVRPGEVVAIMGPSGSGKSTLLSIMGGLLTPDGGEVTVAGEPLGPLPPEARARLRRRAIGFVFQKFNLLRALSALENVALGLHLAGVTGAAGRERAARALANVGLAARAHALPRDLSGGEQQRVAVARALAPEPVLILADEPTGSLDSANGRLVVDLLRAHVHAHDAAAVVVTHDHRLRSAVDRVLWMEDGVLDAGADHAKPETQEAAAG
jgi:putative ABC transport system ATP-binding protein